MRNTRKAALVTGVLLIVAVLISVAAVGALLWSARQGLDARENWIEAELRARSADAAALSDLDWPPYRAFLTSMRTKALYPVPEEMAQWRPGGCSFKDWTACSDVGFDNRHWPVFGLSDTAETSTLLERAPLAQDLFRGGGFACTLYRAAAERDMYVRWQWLLRSQVLTSEEIQQCGELLDRLDAARPSLNDEIEVEYLLQCRDLLRIYHTSQDPEHLIASRTPGLRSLYLRALHFGRLMRRLEELREGGLELASQPPDTIYRRTLPEPAPSEDFLAFRYVQRSVFWFELMASQRRRLLRAALAIARFGADTGYLPERLEDLVPAYLPELPRSPLSGAPFTYSQGTISADVADHLQSWTVMSPELRR